ncbi:MAG: sugar ABC transporter permease [Eubacterium sp.]|jgi:putative multiple sugar transport system permease protein|nr:sugar ABC transporter permease [Eubacterium sp.]
MSRVTDTLRKNTMFIALVVVTVLFQILITSQGKGSLFAPVNITNLINQNGYVVILATGMLLCILTGGNVDLAIGSIVALVGALAGKLIVEFKFNIYISILICLLAGVMIGAWQAFWIAYVRIPPFIVTLAGMLTFRGVTLILLNGLTISPFPEEYTRYFNSYLPLDAKYKFIVSIAIGILICLTLVIMQTFSRISRRRKGYAQESLIMTIIKTSLVSAVVIAIFWLLGLDKGIPVVLIFLAVVVFAYSYYTSNTVPGRHLYAMGGNEKAARLSGINTNKTLFFAYTNMGFLSAVAALVCVARFNSATPSSGTSYELDAIGACFIGGASAYGGVGKVSGAVIGAILIGIINNGMSILGVDSNWQRAVKGLVLLAAVIFDVLSKRRKSVA